MAYRATAARAARVLLIVSLSILAVYVAPAMRAQSAPQGAGATPAAIAPNYDLAANWTSQKVAKLVFDTSVAPRWLETSDRFWYAYQTREGRKFYLVDPVRKSKAPLFDHAKMAATLTSITREPYDAQHLPFTTVKFVRKDAAFQFDVQVPRDAEVAKPKRPATTDSQAVASRGHGDRELGVSGAPSEPRRVNRAASKEVAKPKRPATTDSQQAAARAGDQPLDERSADAVVEDAVQ